MSTVNDPDGPDDSEGLADDAETAEPAEARTAARESTNEPADTSIYVRRGRTPTLGFWVALAIAVPAVAALISAPFFDFPDLGAVVNFVLMVAVMVGLPLAALAALIDAIRHRTPRSRRR